MARTFMHLTQHLTNKENVLLEINRRNYVSAVFYIEN